MGAAEAKQENPIEKKQQRGLKKFQNYDMLAWPTANITVMQGLFIKNKLLSNICLVART